MDKTLKFIFGATGMMLLLLLVWYLVWDASATGHLAAVRESLERQESEWNKQGGNISIRYEEIFASGFPFSTKVRLRRPYIRAEVDGQKILLVTTYLDFIPVDEERWRYRLAFLRDFTVTVEAMQETNYFVHLYDVPEIIVHAPPGEHVAGSNTSEYGVILPPKLMLGIQRGDINRKIAFQYIASAEPMWRYVPQNIDSPLRAILFVLAQATVR